ncbi:MAG: oligosaccharide flippase family protein, partial [Candidatus Nanohaloarchaea archaeon]
MGEENSLAAGGILTESVIYLAAGYIASYPLYYLFRIMLARWLEPSGFGVFSLAFSIFNVSLLLGELGTPTAVNRYVSKFAEDRDEEGLRGTLFSAFEITVPASLFTSAILFIAAPYLCGALLGMPSATPLVRVFAFAIPLRTSMRNFLEVFKGFNRMDYFVALEEVLQSVLLASLTFG